MLPMASEVDLPDARLSKSIGATLGRAIKAGRVALSMSQDELAVASGLSRVTVAKYEDGKATKLSELRSLFQALGQTMTISIGGKGDIQLLVGDPDEKPGSKAQMVEEAMRPEFEALQKAGGVVVHTKPAAPSEEVMRLTTKLAQLRIQACLHDPILQELVAKGFSPEGVTVLALMEHLPNDLRSELLRALVADPRYDFPEGVFPSAKKS